MNESKFLRKKEPVKKNKFMSLLSKIMISFIFFLMFLIISKSNPSLKNKIKEKFFSYNISFAKIGKWYKEKFGNVIPLDDVVPKSEVEVFSETLKYEKKEDYKDGASLEVSKGYLIPALESGVVVFVGEKDGYGKTVIVQQVNGIDVWYGNINSEKVKLYDYVEKGKLIGEVNNNKLYMVFQKEGKFLDYKEYI